MLIKRKVVFIITVVAILAFGGGCSENSNNNESSSDEGSYEKISQSEAKDYMDTETDYIILDVRTQEEYDESHIDGAMLIPYDELDERAEDELGDKNQLLLVYCRSGNRSQIASETLAELGYTNVKDFGGINTWEYGTVE